MKYKKQNGVTLLVLVIMIVILLIIAGITITAGGKTIKEANLESLKTNMLMIQAKTKEYVEQANFRIGKTTADTEEGKQTIETIENEELKGTKITDSTEVSTNHLTNMGLSTQVQGNSCYYYLTQSELDNIGIHNVKSDEKNGWYVVLYDIDNVKTEIYNTSGFQDKYSLTDLQNIKEVE